MAAPYQQIVEDIRRRIAEGELAPGDRVPSTRQIAMKWGVALATAAKALAALSHEGLVEARPRSGTVVADRGHRRRPAGEHGLTRERIVAAAMEIADAEGLGALSMRSVAARLGVSTMSTYRYVGGKDDLVMLMADAAYGEAAWPETPPEGWRARFELVARLLWQVHRRHPWLAHITPLNRPLALPNLMAHGERLLAALDGLGLDPVTMLNLQILVYSHVQGLAANLEHEAQAQAATGVSDQEWVDAQVGAMDLRRLPTFAKVLAGLPSEGYDLDLDEFFEFGLQPLLDGVEALIARDRRDDAPA
ncbi:GntR family transcriptional regulator [Thermomonospora cellulosilytica]|uniref:DNA-binding transcriptional regulator YhcF (GntR family) n=1 Tax=Thermomonospora cellulosilytica TaxID=1411118 RepID=A0A7W3N0B0_9ACTN|nr:GntR family transcriptional regulator [Thermomonospora cellulosilytica]MBA9005184.1 DNA-binding transcriptional regulator YhcF (GntR family) [Thermomonospora cellulosilytica]